MPAEQEVAVRIEDGSTYTVILFNGRLDVKAFKERLADEGLILKALNGAVPAYDSTGLSRTLFSGDIKGDTQAKKGKDANNVAYKHVLYAPLYCCRQIIHGSACACMVKTIAKPFSGEGHAHMMRRLCCQQ